MTRVDPLVRSLSSFDARRVPVREIDRHLPPVPSERLQADVLRHRFRARTADWVPELAGDVGDGPTRPRAQASVLVGLVDRPQGLAVLLTRRNEQLRNHAGQISFPGGRAEPGDADAVQTALREAHEEVGLHPRCVEVLGVLPTYTTVTSFVVTPVVALIPTPVHFRPDPEEVSEVFEVPLSFLMNPQHHRRHRIELGAGQSRHFLSMLWPAEHADTPVANDEYFIWGATAAMLRNLYRFLQA